MRLRLADRRRSLPQRQQQARVGEAAVRKRQSGRSWLRRCGSVQCLRQCRFGCSAKKAARAFPARVLLPDGQRQARLRAAGGSGCGLRLVRAPWRSCFRQWRELDADPAHVPAHLKCSLCPGCRCGGWRCGAQGGAGRLAGAAAADAGAVAVHGAAGQRVLCRVRHAERRLVRCPCRVHWTEGLQGSTNTFYVTQCTVLARSCKCKSVHACLTAIIAARARRCLLRIDSRRNGQHVKTRFTILKLEQCAFSTVQISGNVRYTDRRHTCYLRAVKC